MPRLPCARNFTRESDWPRFSSNVIESFPYDAARVRAASAEFFGGAVTVGDGVRDDGRPAKTAQPNSASAEAPSIQFLWRLAPSNPRLFIAIPPNCPVSDSSRAPL